jgi:hypothetical protein
VNCNDRLLPLFHNKDDAKTLPVDHAERQLPVAHLSLHFFGRGKQLTDVGFRDLKQTELVAGVPGPSELRCC